MGWFLNGDLCRHAGFTGTAVMHKKLHCWIVLSNLQKRLELRKSGTYLQVDSFSIWKKPVISDALAVLWLTSGSSAYQLRVFAATVCQTGGQRRRLEWEAWSKSARKSSPNSRAEGPWGTMWNQETNRFGRPWPPRPWWNANPCGLPAGHDSFGKSC